jgi:hypothetical protein
LSTENKSNYDLIDVCESFFSYCWAGFPCDQTWAGESWQALFDSELVTWDQLLLLLSLTLNELSAHMFHFWVDRLQLMRPCWHHHNQQLQRTPGSVIVQ